MSKKLIAVAAATALALAGLIAPANAAASEASLGDGWAASTGVNDGSTSAKAATVDVPEDNEISVSDLTAGEIDLTTDDGADVVVTATGAARLLKSTDTTDTNSEDVDNTKAGRTSLSFESDGSDTVYVYTTSTTAASVSVRITTSTTTYNKTFYVKGVAGDPYYFNTVAGVPAVLEDGDEAEVSLKLTDVFGNSITGTNGDDYAELTLGSYDYDTSGDFDWNASKGTYLATVTSDQDSAYILTVSMDVSRVDGFAAPSESAQFVVNGKGSANLAKQVADLQAKLANRVTKKRFNTLAKKWNAAFPSQAVKLKK